MYSNTRFQKLNLKILQNFLTFDTKHKIFEIFKNSYFVLFAVTNVQKFFERLLLQNNLCDFILLLLKFDDFWSPKRPCFRILNCNRCFTPSPARTRMSASPTPFSDLHSAGWAAGATSPHRRPLVRFVVSGELFSNPSQSKLPHTPRNPFRP